MHEAYVRTLSLSSCKGSDAWDESWTFWDGPKWIPFGEVGAVKQFLKLDEPIAKPSIEHPSRPVLGIVCAAK